VTKSLTIIGCGAVGSTLGRLFAAAGTFEIRDILNRSLESARQAAGFIGSGRAVADWHELRPADLFLIAACDHAIADCAAQLAATGLARDGVVVWHPSGALPSSVLALAGERGAALASVHPVRSFADPVVSVADFAGTWCGLEGDPPAVALLEAAFRSVGGRTFALDAQFKTVYHAGSVLVCNYLTALLEVGIKAYGKAGLSRGTALEVMEPLVRGTLDNVFRQGTLGALTGPIARGDVPVVAAQLAALSDWDGEIALIYRTLGRVALELARQRGTADDGDLARLSELLAAKGDK